MASTHKSLRSSTANKRPTTAIADGQVALNTNSTSPGLFFKDSTGATIIKIGPVHVGTTAPNASPAVGGSSGNSTGEVWLDTSLTPNGVKIWNGSAWVNATPIGSTTVQGLLELATSAETQTGSDTDRAVTPAGLQSKVSDSTSTTSSTTIASSTAVKAAYDLANAAIPATGGTITGALQIGTTGSLVFEGSTADDFETTIAVVNPTADRTITLPNVTGTVVTTGDSGSVANAMIATDAVSTAKIANDAVTYAKIQNVSATDKLLGRSTAGAGDVEEITCTAAGRAILDDVDAAAQRTTLGLGSLATVSSISNANVAANAEIAVSKLANGTTARQLLQTDAAGTGVEWTSNVDIPGTLDVTGAATFDSTVTATTFTGALSGNASTATTASNLSLSAGAATTNYVLFGEGATGSQAVKTDVDLTYNVSTNTLGTSVTGSSASCTGNAATATKLAATKNINGVPFDGSVDINVPDLRGSNGTILIDGTGVTSAVNYVSLTNAATGGTPVISTAGSDTNVNLSITTKGTGNVSISTGGGNIALRPTAGSILFYDAANTYYTNLDNGSLTANRTLTMPDANVTLVSGTMVPTTRQVIAGNGLITGGALSGDVTLAVGTPSSLTGSTTNAVTADSHTHAITVDLGATAGTTSGPVITSSAGADVTIPSASFSNSGVVTTTTQIFAGQKEFTNSTVINTVNDALATAVTTTVDSSLLYFRGQFWNGTASDNADWTVYNDVDGTGPSGILRFDWEGSTKVTFDEAGTVAATTFSGSGASLTSLNASNISSGTISDARLPADISVSKIGPGALPTDVTVASANIVDGTIVNADISATAAIADTKLATIATAGKVADTALPATISSSITGNAATATNLSSNRTFALTGDVTGSVSSNLSSGFSMSTAVADDSHSHSVSTLSNIESGLYTPTAGTFTNLASVTIGSNNFFYIRVGNRVMVSGRAVVDATATGDWVFRLSIPIAPGVAFADTTKAAGTGNSRTASEYSAIVQSLTSSTTQVTVSGNASITASETVYFNFMYDI